MSTQADKNKKDLRRHKYDKMRKPRRNRRLNWPNDFNFYFKCFAISGLKVFSDNFTGYKFVSAMRLILLERNAKERHISSLLL